MLLPSWKRVGLGKEVRGFTFLKLHNNQVISQRIRSSVTPQRVRASSLFAWATDTQKLMWRRVAWSGQVLITPALSRLEVCWCGVKRFVVPGCGCRRGGHSLPACSLGPSPQTKQAFDFFSSAHAPAPRTNRLRSITLPIKRIWTQSSPCLKERGIPGSSTSIVPGARSRSPATR